MKAQFWSFDVIFAMVIFSLVIVILTYVWYSINSQLSLSEGYGIQNIQMQLLVLRNTIMSQGSPPDWNNIVIANQTSTWSNITAGLGTGQGNEISLQKVMTLMAMSNYDYQATKQVIGIGFDYYISINWNGFTIYLGRNPAYYNAKSIQVVQIPVMMNGVPGTMTAEVWTNTSFGVG
ncbi:MAG: hypothetical protein QW774_00630 [Candidatus Micrarchaeaceae archaeon]